MVTGAYPATHGVTDNFYWDRASRTDGENVSLVVEDPAMVMVPTVFDVLESRERFDTGVSIGSEFLRRTFDCTRTENGSCGPSAANPEKVTQQHLQPTWWRGAVPDVDWRGWRAKPGGLPVPSAVDDCPAEPLTPPGHAPDHCVMTKALDFIDEGDPDFTLVNLGDVDLVAHLVAMNTEATRQAVREEDRQVGRLIDCIKGSAECPNGSPQKWAHSVLFVVSDHSFSHTQDQGHVIDLAAIFRHDPELQDLVEEGGHRSVDEAIQIVGSLSGNAAIYLDDVAGDAPFSDIQERILARVRKLLVNPNGDGVRHPGISEAWYRLDNSFDPGNDLATRRPAWGLHGNQRTGELLVTALASAPTFDLLDPDNPDKSRGGNAFETATGPGYNFEAFPVTLPLSTHGHPGTRHVLFVVAGGERSCVRDHVVALDKPMPPPTRLEGDDTRQLAGQAENVDIGPTVLWALGLVPSLLEGRHGRVLREAFHCRPAS